MRFSLLALPLCMLLAACSAPEENPTLAATGTTDIPLYEAEPERRDLGQLTYLGGFAITHADERFGGLSALHLNEDGSRILAVSDRAYWISGNLSWTSEGAPATLSALSISPILSRAGTPLEGEAADSEAIAALDGHVFAVSFERDHRINLYELGAEWSRMEAPGLALQAPPGATRFENNGGMEGLTRLEDGRLLAGVEDTHEGERRLFILEEGEWSETRLRAEPRFGLTALAAHQGYVYALERFWQREIGNRIRIIRFQASALDTSARIEPELLGLLEAGMSVDNFEAMDLIEREGRTVLLIGSDDNYSENQRTLLMAFEVGD